MRKEEKIWNPDPLRDPEKIEPTHLKDIGHLSGANVIEIGCGNGRLTWRYAKLPNSIIGFDPEISGLHEAKNARPLEFSSKVGFVQALAESLPVKSQIFNVALLAWSL